MLRSYFEYMLKSSIAIWWVLATALIDILSFILLPNLIPVTRIWFLVLIFLVSFSLLASVVIFYKGWLLYSQKNARIVQYSTEDNERIFILDGLHNIETGSLLEIFRIREGVHIPIGFIEITLRREDGRFQAIPIWIAPIHRGDIEQSGIATENLRIYPNIRSDRLSKWIDNQAKLKVDDLLKRGEK